MRVPQVSERIKEAPAQALRGVFAGIGQLLLISDKLRNKAPAEVPHAKTPEASETAAGSVATGSPATEPAAAPAAPAAPTAPAESAAPAAPAAPAESVAPPVPATPPRTKPAPARDFDKTGNVRLISDGGAPAAPPDRIITPSAPEPDVTPPADVTPEPDVTPAADVTPANVITPADVVAPAGEVAGPVLPSTAAEDEREDSAPPPPALPPLPNYDQLSVASLRARLRMLDVTQVRELADYERAHAARADVITMFERRIVKLEAEA